MTRIVAWVDELLELTWQEMFELITQIYKDVSIQDVKDYNNKEWEVSEVDDLYEWCNAKHNLCHIVSQIFGVNWLTRIDRMFVSQKRFLIVDDVN